MNSYVTNVSVEKPTWLDEVEKKRKNPDKRRTKKNLRPEYHEKRMCTSRDTMIMDSLLKAMERIRNGRENKPRSPRRLLILKGVQPSVFPFLKSKRERRTIWVSIFQWTFPIGKNKPRRADEQWTDTELADHHLNIWRQDWKNIHKLNA